jgi:hypothetical protein
MAKRLAGVHWPGSVAVKQTFVSFAHVSTVKQPVRKFGRSSLSQVFLVPRRPLDRQAGPLSLELRLDPPLELSPLFSECPADGQAESA